MNLLRSCFWNVSNDESNKCSTTKGKTILCSNLGNDICSLEIGNIKNEDCIWDGNNSVCIEYKWCAELDSLSCENVDSSLIKDGGRCKWIKVLLNFIFYLIKNDIFN
jgi:hypothetical protein